MSDREPVDIMGVIAFPNPNKDERVIRFIDSEYHTLFTIKDGESIVITRFDGEKMVFPCKYIDDCHVCIGNSAYHICEFAEMQERSGNTYEPARNVSKTYNEIDRMGQKTITGKMAISKEDYSELTALAKEGITSRAEISELEQSANYYRQKYFDCANALERMKTKYNELKEKCRPFLQALEHFPEVAKLFTEKVKQLFSFKEAQERAEKEAREKERQERIKARRNKRGMER